MHPGDFWGKTEAYHANSSCLGLDYREDVHDVDITEPLVGVRVVSTQSGHLAPVFPHVEEYVEAILEWAGFYIIRYEVIDGVPFDNILLVVQGKYNLDDLL